MRRPSWFFTLFSNFITAKGARFRSSTHNASISFCSLNTEYCDSMQLLKGAYGCLILVQRMYFMNFEFACIKVEYKKLHIFRRFSNEMLITDIWILILAGKYAA